MSFPDYCCAILTRGDSVLLEVRPPSVRLAGGQLTCFGGRREEGETPEECLRRELMEELAWVPETLSRALELRVSDRLIAWFYTAELSIELDQLRLEPGRSAVLVDVDALQSHKVSPWHQAVLAGWQNGETVITL